MGDLYRKDIHENLPKWLNWEKCKPQNYHNILAKQKIILHFYLVNYSVLNIGHQHIAIMVIAILQLNS